MSAWRRGPSLPLHEHQVSEPISTVPGQPEGDRPEAHRVSSQVNPGLTGRTPPGNLASIGLQSSMSKPHVLIVEDEHDIAGLIKHTLERTGDAVAEIVGSG